MATKTNSKPCQISEMELFPRSRYWLQGQTQDLVKHLRWSFYKNSQKQKAVKAPNMLVNIKSNR